MKEKTQKLFSILNFSLIAIFVVMFMYRFSNPPPPEVPAAAPVNDPALAPPAQPEEKVSCGTVIENCVAEVSLGLPDCNAAEARQRLNELLSTPSSTAQCEAARSRLSRACAAGCTIDEQTLFVIAGKIELNIPPRASEDGSCVVNGKREVKMSAVCS